MGGVVAAGEVVAAEVEVGLVVLEHVEDRYEDAVLDGGARSRRTVFSAVNSVHRAPCGVDVKDLRPLRGRPFGPIPDPDAYPGALTDTRRTARRKIRNRNGGWTSPAP